MAALEARAAGAPAQEALPGPRQPTMGGYARELVGPTVEALGAIGGGALGTVALPGVGTLAGAGLGYGIARQALERFDVARGAKAAPELGQQFLSAAGDVLQGATSEAAGRVVGQGVQRGIEAVKQIPRTRAASLVTNALARDKIPVDDAVNALLSAPKGTTAGEALSMAGLEGQTTQALLGKSISRDPAYVGRLLRERSANQLAQLGELAGGATQAAARGTQEQAVKNLSQLTEPQKRAALARANLGATQLDMSATAVAARQQAEEAVEGVRRFTRAGTEAAPRIQGELSTARFPGQPRVPFRATYMGELAERADEVASAMAQKSLDAGAVARANEQAIRTQQAYGIKPLTPEPILARIRAVRADPENAFNDPLKIVLGRVESELTQWQLAGGIVHPSVLDSLRKNINTVAQEYAKGDPNLQREVAGKITASLRPTIIDAIEKAGGKGYAKYLADYSKARQGIDQKKLGAVAMDMLRTDGGKKAFIELVEGNDLNTVEKVFGPGSYDIAKELSQEALAKFKNISAVERAALTSAKQASEGGEALRKLLADNLPTYRLPAFFSAKITATNQALDKLQDKIGRRTMDILTKGAESGQALDDLLRGMGVAERARLERLFRQAGESAVSRVGTAATLQTLPEVRKTTEREINFLFPETDNRNALAR
jgi:hypothetical protein